MRRLAALALCLLFSGCLADTTAPPASALPGTWALVAVNESPVPFTYPNGKQITDQTIVFSTDGSFDSLEHYSDGTEHFSEGAFTVIGDTILFTDVTDNIQFQADWTSTSMTQHIGSYHLRFQKL